jgi:hypothetical protein
MFDIDVELAYAWHRKGGESHFDSLVLAARHLVAHGETVDRACERVAQHEERDRSLDKGID